MADLMAFGVKIVTEGVQESTQALDKVVDTGNKAAKTAENLRREFDNVQKAVRPMEQATKQAASSLSRMEQSMNKATATASKLTKMVVGFVSIRAVLRQLSTSTKLAAQFESLGTAIKASGTQAGYSAAQLKQYEQDMNSVGISLVGTRQAMMRMIGANMDLANSQKLAVAATNLAIAANKGEEESLLSLIQAIQTGNARSIRAVGVAVDFSAAYADMARSLGLTTTQLSEQQKQMARTNEVLNKMSVYSSVAASAQDSFSAKMLITSRMADNLRVRIGQLFQGMGGTILDSVSGQFESLARSMENLGKSDGFKVFGDAVSALVRHIDTLIVGLLGFVAANKLVNSSMVTSIKQFQESRIAANLYAANLKTSFNLASSAVADMQEHLATLKAEQAALGSNIRVVDGVAVGANRSAVAYNNLGRQVAIVEKEIAQYSAVMRGVQSQLAASVVQTSLFSVALDKLRSMAIAVRNSLVAMLPTLVIMGAITALYELATAQSEAEKTAELHAKALGIVGSEALTAEERIKRMTDAVQKFNIVQVQTELDKLTDSSRAMANELDILVANLETMGTDFADVTGGMFDGVSAGPFREVSNALREQINLLKQIGTDYLPTFLNRLSEIKTQSPAMKELVDQIAEAGVAFITSAEGVGVFSKRLDELQKAVNNMSVVSDLQKDFAKWLDVADRTPKVATSIEDAGKALEGLLKGTYALRIEEYNRSKQEADNHIQFIKAKIAELQAQQSILIASDAVNVALGREADNLSNIKMISDQIIEATRNLKLYEEGIKDLKPPKPGGGSGSGNGDRRAKLEVEMQQKLNELKLKQMQVEAEITMENQAQAAIYQLEIEREKELLNIKEDAARLGMQTDPRIAQLEQITDAIYAMKIAQEEHNKVYEVTLRDAERQVELTDILGTETEKLTAQYALLAVEYERAFNRPGISEGQKAYETAKYQKTVDALTFSTRYLNDETYKLYLTEKARFDQLLYTQQLEQQRSAEMARYLDAPIEAAATYQGSIEALSAALDAGAISQDTFNAKMLEASILFQTAKAEMGDLSFIDSLGLGFASLTEGYTNFVSGATIAFGDFFNDFTTGFANSIGQAIWDMEDFGQAIQNVARNAISQLISALIQMGIQWAITQIGMQAASTAASAASTAALVAEGIALNAAYTPAAIMASIATSGAAAVAGMSAFATAVPTMTALSSAMSVLGGFSEGGYTGNARKDEIAGFVHGQEYVIDAGTVNRYGVHAFDALTSGDVAGFANSVNAQNAASAAYFNQFSRGTTTPNISISIENYGTSKEFEVQQDDEHIRIIARDVAQEVLRDEGPSVIAGDLANTNSQTSKALGRYTDTSRRYM